MNKWLILSFLLAAFSKAALGNDSSIGDISTLEEFRQTFQKDAGKLRIVALLSPT